MAIMTEEFYSVNASITLTMLEPPFRGPHIGEVSNAFAIGSRRREGAVEHVGSGCPQPGRKLIWRKLMGWHHNDITAAAGAPLPSVDESISAYAFEDQGTQHVIYVGQDSHINELWWDNNGWHHNDLTAATGAPLPGNGQSRSAYAFER
jgi:hypothetical protein